MSEGDAEFVELIADHASHFVAPSLIMSHVAFLSFSLVRDLDCSHAAGDILGAVYVDE